MYVSHTSAGWQCGCSTPAKITSLVISGLTVAALVALSVLTRQHLLLTGASAQYGFYSFVGAAAATTLCTVILTGIWIKNTHDHNQAIESVAAIRKKSEEDQRAARKTQYLQEVPVPPSPRREENINTTVLRPRNPKQLPLYTLTPQPRNTDDVNSVKISSFEVQVKASNLQQARSECLNWISTQQATGNRHILLQYTLEEIAKNAQFTPTLVTQFTWQEAQCKAICVQSMPNSTLSTTPHKYDFTQEGHYFVHTANPDTFGGHFFTNALGQEESLAYSFPQLFELAFLFTQTKSLLPCKNENGDDCPTPLLICNTKQLFKMSRDLTAAYKDSAGTFEQLIKTPGHLTQLENTPPVHHLGMAVPAWEKDKKAYTEKDLAYLLNTALTAFMGIKALGGDAVIHTENWGLQINSAPTMATIQIVAARMANVTLIVHMLAPGIIGDIDTLLKGCKTPNEAIKALVKKQETDRKVWGIKSN